MAERLPRVRGGMRTALRAGIGAAIGLLLLLLLARGLDLDAVGRILSRASFWPFIAALLALCADFVLRAMRFWLMLRAAGGTRLGFGASVAPFIASFGMSDLLPLRVGDGLRVVWFCRRFDLPAGTVIGAMVVERMFDLTSLLLFTAVASAAIGGAAAGGIADHFRVAASVGAVAVLAILLAPALLGRAGHALHQRSSRPWLRRAAAAGVTIADAIRQIGRWQHLVGLFGLSVILWMLEGGVMVGAWISLGGAHGQLWPPLLAFGLATLGTLVPSLPGHFGTFEFAGVQAFAYAGVDLPFATAVVLLCHLVLWAPTALFAIAWLSWNAVLAARLRGEAEQPALQG